MARHRTGPLVEAGELSELVAAPVRPVLLDVRWPWGSGSPRERYLAGHLPGAAYVDLDRDLAAPPGDGSRGRHPLPEPATFEAAMRLAGVSDGTLVVVYDDVSGLAAARGWWLLRWAGHAAVRVLDGGLAAWVAAGGALEPGVVSPLPGDFVARPGASPVLDAEEAAALARRGVLLDARAGERYRGEEEPFDPVAGHVPGARSLPTAGNLDADGRFLDAAALRSRFAEAGVGEGMQEEVGVYCGSGVTAAHELLALELAGLGPGALYVGSWSEWAADSNRPVATGPDPG